MALELHKPNLSAVSIQWFYLPSLGCFPRFFGPAYSGHLPLLGAELNIGTVATREALPVSPSLRPVRPPLSQGYPLVGSGYKPDEGGACV